MTQPNPKCLARQAGIFYLLMILGAIGLIYVPSQIFVQGDPVATLQQLQAHEGMHRWGIFTNVICQLAFLMVGIKLYQLFHQKEQGLSLMLLGTVIASIPVAFQLIFHQSDALLILRYDNLVPADMQQLVYQSMDKFSMGLYLIGFFWGLWLIPFGALAIRTGFMPKIIGYLLIAGGTTYILDSMIYLLLPSLHPTTEILNGIFSSLAEFSAILFLLIKGVKTPTIYN